ncbi:MAG TPA: hypothetical protein VGC97_02125 [Pyrinomonadaceae bacterium]|jgi:hypothetical protein
MKRNLFIIAVNGLLLVQIAFGQKPPVKTAPKTQTPTTAQKLFYPKLKIQAEERAKAMVTGDFAKVADFTYPKVVESFGGKDKMVAVLKNDTAQMKAEGFEVAAMTIGVIKQIARVETEIFAIVPVAITIKSPAGKDVGESSIVGISNDNGVNWKFIDGINQEKFKAMFPKAAEKLQIPEEKPPQPVENE